MELISRSKGRTAPRAEARRQIDAAVADAHGELDHRELAALLLEARDTLLVTGRVPGWFGDADAGRYECLAGD
jgi:hypothetical protein